MTSGKPTRHPTFPFDACSLIHIQIAFSYPSTLLTYLLGDKRKVIQGHKYYIANQFN